MLSKFVSRRFLQMTWGMSGRRGISSTRSLRSKDDDEEYKEVEKIPPENPIKRTARIFLHDLKSIVDPYQPPLLEFSTHVDICVIGGGIIGSSIAYWIRQRVPNDSLRVSVIEKDPNYTRSATALSVGGLRQQFSMRENIEMSLFSADWLRRVPELLATDDCPAPDVQFNPQGYLFLANADQAAELEENYLLQTSLGAKVDLMSAKKLKEKFPWVNAEGIELASYGMENEGWFDPWSLLCSLKQKNISMGVEYVQAEVIGFEFRPDTWLMAGMDPNEMHEGIDKIIVKTPSGEHKNIKFATTIVAAGHESAKIAEMARIGRKPGMLSVPLPVEPRKRYIYCFNAPNGPGLDCPLVVDPSGTYFRREGLANHYLAGKSPHIGDEPNTETLDVDYSYFDNEVYPDLVGRVPSFQNVKMKSAWAGYYDYNSFDQNGILGPHPYYPNFYFATGFSGFGIQHAPAIGRAVMEMVLDGEFCTIDLHKLNFERFLVGKEVTERNIV